MSERNLGLLTIGWALFLLGDILARGIALGLRDAGAALIIAAVVASVARGHHDD